MIRIFFSLISFFLFCSCIYNQNSNLTEVYRYNKSSLDYCLDIHCDNVFNRIAFVLNMDKKNITVSVYKNDNKVNSFVIKTDDSEAKLFTEVIENQLKSNNVFSSNKNRKGYNVGFLICGGGDCLSTNYQNILKFRENVSEDFDKLIVFLRKEKRINFFFEQKIK